MIRFRPPIEGDFEQSWVLALSMHAESYYSGMEINKRKFQLLFESGMSNPMFFCRVFENDQQLVGFFMGLLSEQFFGYDTVALDLGLYVIPEQRGKAARCVVDTIKQYEHWAFAAGAVDCTLGVSAGITDERSIKLYERLGFTKGSMMLHKKRALRD